MKPIRKPDPAVKRMAAKGRHGDNAAVHVTKGEMLIPPQVMANDPLLRHRAMMAFAQMGKDPNEFVVGNPKAKKNPRTGAQEFAMQEIAFDPTHYTQQYGSELAQAGVDTSDPNALWGYYNDTGRDLGQTANVYEEGARDAGFSGNFAGNWGTDVAGTNYDPTSENYSGTNFELPSYYAAQNVDKDFKAGGRDGRKRDENAGNIQGWWNNADARLNPGSSKDAYNTKWAGDQFGMNSYDMSQIDAAMRNGTTFPTDRIANMTWADRSNFYHTFGYDPATRIDGGYQQIEGMPPGVMGGNINSVIGGTNVPQSFGNIDMLARYNPQQLSMLSRQWPASTGNDPYSANMLDFLAGRQIHAPVYSGPANSGPGRPSGGYIGTFTHNYPGAGQDGNYLVRGANGAATVKLDDLANGKVSLQAVQRALDTGTNLPGGATNYSLHPADLANIDPNFAQFAQGTSGFGDEQYIFDDRLPTDYYTNPKSPGYYRSANPGENSQSMIDATPEMITPVNAGYALYRHKDGTIVDGEGWAMQPFTFPNGQKGYKDSYYPNTYRMLDGNIVDASGNPHRDPAGNPYYSTDYLRVFGSQGLNGLGLPSRDSPPNGEGGGVGGGYLYGAYGTAPTTTGTRAASTNTGASPFAPNTGAPGGVPGAPQQPGGTPNPTGAPQTGSGLPAGQANPYSYPSYPGGLNLNFYNGQQPTTGGTGATPTTNQQGYYGLQMTPGGYPYWGGYSPTPTDPNATQDPGGISGYTPNNQTVDFRPAFSY